MRYLLDAERNQLLLSAASSWEIALKLRKGRVHLPSPPDRYMPDRLLASDVDAFPVLRSHALGVSLLDDHHSDPFDLMLVSQEILEILPIISADPSQSADEVEWIDATK